MVSVVQVRGDEVAECHSLLISPDANEARGFILMHEERANCYF